MDDRIVIIGGFSGARAAQSLIKAGFSNVTLIDKKEYYEVTYSTLRTLCDPSMGQKARMRYADFLTCKFLHADVKSISENSVTLADGSLIPFDHAIIATGSHYHSFPIAKSAHATRIEERVDEFTSYNAALKAAHRILIVGGGPVGVELAGEIADHFPSKSIMLVEGGSRLLSAFKPKASQIAERQLQDMGVAVRYNYPLSDNDPLSQKADIVYMCVGQSANTALMQEHFAGSLDEMKRIKVDGHMRVENSAHIYAVGDCANAPGAKLGFLADKQAAVAVANILATKRKKALKRYKPPAMMGLVPIGRRGGLFQFGWFVSTFKPMVNLKQKDMFISGMFDALGVKR